MNFSSFLRKINAEQDPMERLRLIVLLLFVFTLPFDIYYSSVLIFLIIVLIVIDLSKAKFRRIPKQIVLFQMIFFIAVAGYAYSFHKDQASFLMERQLSILIFPFLLPLAVNITPVKVKLALTALTYSVIVALLYLFGNIVSTVTKDLNFDVEEAIRSDVFFNHQFTKPLGIHAGYMSLYVAMAFFYVLYEFNRRRRQRSRVVAVFILLFLAAGQFFLASRNIIIGSIFILGVIYPLFLLKRKWRHVLVFALGTILFFVILSRIPYLNTRFSEDLISDIKLDVGKQDVVLKGIEPRIERWKAGWDLFLKSPLIGYGTGDEISMLKTEYAKRQLYISYVENFNAHNQYLSYLLKNGIVGLLVFVSVILYYVRIAWKKRDFLYMTFLTLLIIGFYTENILDANKGIIYFAFFNTFFGYSLLEKRSSKAVQDPPGVYAPSAN